MLSNEQYDHFETFGFVVLRRFFDPEEVGILREEFERGLDLAYRQHPFDGSERHCVQQMGPDTPYYAGLLEDERFWSTTAQIYGDDAFAVVTDANRYIGDTSWHFDHFIDPAEDCYGVKFVFYLDPVDPDTGALRLVPGSHKNPLHNDLRESMPSMGLAIRDVPAFVCSFEPVDVIAFDMRCWHASSGGVQGRRMSTCCYYKNPETPEEERGARNRAAMNRTPSEYKQSGETLFHADWTANSKGSVLRQGWIQRLRELDFLPAD